jgi:hypothetical protein
MTQAPHLEHDAVVDLLRRELTPERYEEIRELWKRHSIAEDARSGSIRCGGSKWCRASNTSSSKSGKTRPSLAAIASNWSGLLSPPSA